MNAGRAGVWGLLLIGCCLPAGTALGAEVAAVGHLDGDFSRFVQPMLKQYCLDCHSAEKHKGDLDLERFSSLVEVKKHPKIWQGVIAQIVDEEMPPKDKPQPTVEDRRRLLSWVQGVLDEIALSRAGDPGPVVLRRLSNAEYTYTIRDLTGVQTLEPAREFPTDSASGEGFMNVGNSLVMSPALVTKYFDAGKGIARHAVLLPDGIRFSPETTRRDWTEEILAEIRNFYGQFTDNGGGMAVNLQGIKFDTKDGGVLPLEKYLEATVEMREGRAGETNNSSPLTPALSLRERENNISAGGGAGGVRVSVRAGGWVASEAAKRGLSEKYLGLLWNTLDSTNRSFLLDPIRARWRSARPGEAAALAKDIAQWQQTLWTFNSVGHIGKAGGPTGWMEAVSPLATKQEIRLRIPASAEGNSVTLYLVASDAGDGTDGDHVVWESPRLVAPGRPDLLLRDAGKVSRELAERRETLFAAAGKCLAAAAEAGGGADVNALATKHGVEADALSSWLDYLGIGSKGPARVEGYFTNLIQSAAGYDFVKGWGSSETPSVMANSSDQDVRIPGNMKPRSVAVHPSPKLAAAVGWRSPVTASVRVQPTIQHAHPECGNGVSWALELRRGGARQRLASGTAQGTKEVKPAALDELAVQTGDLVSLLIGPREGNHSCDLTAVDLVFTTAGEDGRVWDLAKDVSPDIVAGNPHADRFGNKEVWHFYGEAEAGGAIAPGIPAGSLLAKWQISGDSAERAKLGEELQRLLAEGPPAEKDSPDGMLYRQLSSLSGPLLGGFVKAGGGSAIVGTGGGASSLTPSFAGPTEGRPAVSLGERGNRGPAVDNGDVAGGSEGWGLDPKTFGGGPAGFDGDGASLFVRAPSVMEVRLPADLVEGCEFVATGRLQRDAGREGSVQLQVLTRKPEGGSSLMASAVQETQANGPWTSNNRGISHSAPILVNEGSAARKRIEDSFDEFRQVFPAALCYTKIVPVDEVVTLTLFYREDHHLKRLMLDDEQAERLDRLWDEMHYVSQDALTLVDAFEQLWQYATQDADPKVFEPMREPIKQRAASYRQRLVDTEPRHLESVLKLADKAYRRPLTKSDKAELNRLYRELRGQSLPHDEAIRLLLARVLVAPAFLYRAEKPGPGAGQGPVGEWELATRLSYFLWSSTPDEPLRMVAAKGRLSDPEVLTSETRRMARDGRVRRLATEFACAWLHIYGFDELSEKSERHFPSFNELRGVMYEETIRFFADLFQNDGSILDILDADYTFLNDALAKHYNIPGVNGSEWRRVAGLKQFSRGGVLGQATTLAKQSGASRTSPILRGNWVSEVLLGEKLPRPPKDVPLLPEDEATETLTVRQLTEKHTSDPSCYGCHRRIDPYGYALEGFDAIGRHRERDLGDRPIDTRTKTLDGAELEGLEGLRSYLLTQRRDAFVRQFSRKLLGYALGREVLLSDEPLLKEMAARLKSTDYRVSTAIETIVRSRQFREIRGMELAAEE